MAGPWRVTVTPGNTPPDASLTLPMISPVVRWAIAGAATSNNRTPTKNLRMSLASLSSEHPFVSEKSSATDQCSFLRSVVSNKSGSIWFRALLMPSF